MSEMIEVTDGTFARDVEARAGLTLVDFWATWCGPCRIIEPSLAAIAEARGDTLRVTRVNADDNAATAARFGIRALPTLLLVKDGQVVDRIVGAVPRARIDAVIDSHA